jgi:hypothetical protein
VDLRLELARAHAARAELEVARAWLDLAFELVGNPKHFSPNLAIARAAKDHPVEMTPELAAALQLLETAS